jgi:Ca2+-binding RTX toxin-like protein
LSKFLNKYSLLWFAEMNLSLFSYVGSLLFVVLAVVGTTVVGSSNTTNSVWAEVFEGTEGLDFIEGTPAADIIDSKGGDDSSTGDTFSGDGSGNDIIDNGEGNDINSGDSSVGDGSGDDVIVSGEEDDSNFGDAVPAFGGTGSGSDVIISGGGDDTNTGNEGRDIFVCGEGEEDTVTDFNEEEGDIATPDCENI